MKQLVAIYTEHRFCKVGVSLWGNGGHDKVDHIEFINYVEMGALVMSDQYGDNLRGMGRIDCWCVNTRGGREIFVKAEHVIAVEYQEVQDAANS